RPTPRPRRTRHGASCCAWSSGSDGRTRTTSSRSACARRVERRAPELLPWLPLLAIPFDADLAPTRELEELSPDFRRDRLHEVVGQFLRTRMAEPALVEIRDAHLMDAASAELLRAVSAQLTGGPWLVLVTRRDVEG